MHYDFNCTVVFGKLNYCIVLDVADIICFRFFISLDIIECDVLIGGCSHYCNNTDGSYYCSCPVGYELTDQQLCKGKLNA